jgi:hypothetical protein
MACLDISQHFAISGSPPNGHISQRKVPSTVAFVLKLTSSIHGLLSGEAVLLQDWDKVVLNT